MLDSKQRCAMVQATPTSTEIEQLSGVTEQENLQKMGCSFVKMVGLDAALQTLLSRLDFAVEGFKPKLKNPDYLFSHQDSASLHTIRREIIKRWHELSNCISQNLEEFLQIRAGIEQAINQSSDALIALIRHNIFGEKTVPKETATLEDVDYIHQEWEADAFVRDNLASCDGHLFDNYGYLIIDLLNQLSQHLRAHYEPIKPRIRDGTYTNADVQTLFSLTNLAMERFSIHWTCSQVLTENVSLSFSIDLVDTNWFSKALSLLGSIGKPPTGQVIINEYAVILSEGFTNGTACLSDFLRWCGERSDLFEMEYIAYIKSTCVNSSLPLVELNSKDHNALCIFLKYGSLENDTLTVSSLSIYYIKSIANLFKSEIGEKFCSVISASNPRLRTLQRDCLMAVNNTKLVLAEIVAAIPLDVLQICGKKQWNVICSLTIEGALQLIFSNNLLSLEKRKEIVQNSITITIKWSDLIIASDLPTHESLNWGLSALKQMFSVVSGEALYCFDANGRSRILGMVIEKAAAKLDELKVQCDGLENGDLVDETNSVQLKEHALLISCLYRKLAECKTLYLSFINTLPESIDLDTDSIIPDAKSAIPRPCCIEMHKFQEMSWAGALRERGYEVIKAIGSGASGSVYRAMALETGLLVALKVYRDPCDENPSLETNILEKEAKLLSTIRHTRVVNVYNVFRIENYTFLTMELCEGGNLEEYFRREKLYGNLLLVKHFCREIAHGLNFLHMRHVVHGDLKAENILLTQPDPMTLIPGTKLGDFGSSRVSRTIKLFRTGYMGTVTYMAPEVLKGAKPTTESDIWSFGCMLYHLYTGKHPWDHIPNDWAIVFMLGSAKSLDGKLPKTGFAKLDELVSACLRIDPNERLNSLKLITHDFLKASY